MYENGEYVLTERYTYDKLNQLKRADLRDAGTTTKYFYNAGGNILVREVYAYTTEDTPRNIKNTINYDYTDTSWKDLMTKYSGQTITYDGMGNPLNYRDGISFTWKNGRRMESSTVGSIVTTYDYDIDGNRVYRAGAGYKRKYTVIDGVTLGEQITFNGKTHSMEYMRDENGDVYGFIYDRDTYYLEKNALGDVKYLLDANGAVVAKYTYDEWGKKISVTDANGNAITDGTNIAHLNPFRYRSYYYDDETGLYYLGSRYYDPVTCRFVNADSQINSGSAISYNLFAYCENNPIVNVDPDGHFVIASSVAFGVTLKLVVAAVVTVVAAVVIAEVSKAIINKAVDDIDNARINWEFRRRTDTKTDEKEKDSVIPSQPEKQGTTYYHVTTPENAAAIMTTRVMTGSSWEAGHVYAWKMKPSKYAIENSGAHFGVTISFKTNASFSTDPGISDPKVQMYGPVVSDTPGPIIVWNVQIVEG